MKRYILLLVLFSFTLSVYCQQITFQKAYGGTFTEMCYSGQQTTDGGYIIVGETNGFGAGTWLIYLIKTDANGDTLWTKTIGGSGYDNGLSVEQTTDGGYIIAGYGDSFGTGGFNIYLIKTDAAGNVLWSKTFGGGPFDIYPGSVQQTTDGGYILTGDIGGSIGDYDVYLIKTDANGDTLWTKIYGGLGDDDGYSVRQTNDGGYIITGETYSFGAGSNDVYLIKTDSNGNLLWSKTYGGVDEDLGNSVQQTTDHGYIITGYMGGLGGGAFSLYLIKTDSSGNLLWSKTFSGPFQEVGFSVQQTTDGGYIIGGETESFSANFTADVYLIKTDANGNLLWSKIFGGTDDDVGGSVQQTTDGGYVITGYTRNFGSGGYSDAYLIKTDSLGNSGCNEGIPAPIVTTPSTLVTTPATITASPADILTSPSMPSGSGGIVTTLCTTVGIQSENNNLKSAISVTPNPFTDVIKVTDLKIGEKASIFIYDLMGEKVFEKELPSNKTEAELNLSFLQQGVYFLNVKGNGESWARKIVKM